MFTKEAILELQKSHATVSAFGALESAHETNHIVALPSDFKLHDLETNQVTRRRARGTMITNSVDSFVDYTKAHAEHGAHIFISQSDMIATAVLNLGTPDSPGQCDNRAELKLKKTAAFIELLSKTSNALKQADAAEFFEDWSGSMICYADSGEQIPDKQAIAALRKLTIESVRKIENSEQQLSTVRSAFESVQASSSSPLPSKVRFICQPYSNLPMREFDLRLSVSTATDKPTIKLHIIKLDEHMEHMALEIADRISSEFSDSQLPVLLGSYSRIG